ncbi:MAG: hypothetical protein ACMXYG_01525 [Candidatus Woesearchaeota archaeon]
MFQKIFEGKAIINAPLEKKISKDLPVFYNPIMEYNRTISIEILNILSKKEMDIALPLAGTGVRAVRFFKELNKEIIKQININDYDKDAITVIKKNLKNNKIKTKYKIYNLDANLFFTQSKAFDYIDIDPFGSPTPFLNNSIMHLKRDSILAVTATDTSALCGTYENACKRKYWAKPLHNEEMHEIGLRILIRKCQLIGVQFEKALIPIFSYSKDHYMRIFFKCIKGKSECDKILKKHEYYKKSGPLWIGQLKDKKLTTNIKLNDTFTKTLKQELDILGFYEIPSICKKEKISQTKKINEIINEIKKQKYKVTRTHFAEQGIKTNMPYEKFIKILKKE